MKRFVRFDMDKPSEVVSSGFVRLVVLLLGLGFATILIIGVMLRLGWVDTGNPVILIPYIPLGLALIATAILATAGAAVGLFIAARLPAPKPLAERSLLLASSAWVLRVFLATAALVVGGIIGGFIAQSLDAVAEMARTAPPPEAGEPNLSAEAAAVVVALINLVYGWTALAVTLALFAAGIAVAILSIRLLTAGRQARFNALSPRTDPDRVTTERRLAWRHHFSHWGYPAYLLVYLFFFGWFIATLLALPLDYARAAAIAFVESLVA